jgi:hypothetical protein
MKKSIKKKYTDVKISQMNLNAIQQHFYLMFQSKFKLGLG